MLRAILLALTLVCLTPAGAVALAGAPGEAPPTLILRALKITGAKIIPAKKIKEELLLPLPSPLPWKKPPVFRPEELEADVMRLQRFYRRQGFYHTVIDARVAQTEDGRVNVTLNVTEGTWVKVTRLEVTPPLAGPAPDLAELRKKTPLKVGERFEEGNYDALKRLYLNYLLDHGFPKAKVEGRVRLDEDNDTAEIEITLTPGPFCYFGAVSVKGKTQAPEGVIRRKLTFKEGDAFSLKELYDSQNRLYGLDLFKSVILTPEEVSEGERKIPITIEVQDKKQRSLKVGLGYGDEDEIRARLGLRFRNFLGGGRMLDLDTKYSSLEYRVESTLFNPLVFGTNNDAVFQTGFVRRYLPGFTDKAFFTSVRLERDLPWKFRGSLGHGLEFSRPFNIPVETLLLLGESETGKLFRASMAMAGLRQETVDNAADPHRGGIFTLSGEAAPDFFGSTVQFLRSVAEIRRYHSLWGTDFILAGRLKCGIIQPIQGTVDIPIFRRFFAGGYNSVRGYRLDYLGPRTPGGQPLGGETLLEGSVEARIPIYKEFRAVAFLDFGNVFFKVKDMDIGQLKYSSGFGLRYHTPIGPIGVDIGFPLNPINRRQDDSYRVHFTIGQAF